MNSIRDKQLVVKSTFNGKHKKITFQSARNCTFKTLRDKVDQAYSLYGTLYNITYKDDDGEIIAISNDVELDEAIQWFQGSDDAPLSSASSILSGRSFQRKILLRVEISMEYDGPSLSDTSSMVSVEEFRGRNGSQHSFTAFNNTSMEPDDDSVTVSSKDFGSSSANSTPSPPSYQNNPFSDENASSSLSATPPVTRNLKHTPRDANVAPADATIPDGSLYTDAANRYPEDPTPVLEKLRLSELMSDSSSVNRDLGGNARGQAWLRDQEERVIRSKLGMLPEPSEVDDAASSLVIDNEFNGGLALERNPRGSYYYTYTTSIHSQEDDTNPNYDAGTTRSITSLDMSQLKPTPLHLHWLASQQTNGHRNPQLSESLPFPDIHASKPLPLRGSKPSEGPAIHRDLPYLQITEPPEDILTDCSNCGVQLRAIRYICSSCGERKPRQADIASKGKGRDVLGRQEQRDSNGNTCIPMNSLHHASSATIIGSSESLSQVQQRTLVSLPSLPSLFHTSRRRLSGPGSPTVGYELCPNCILSVGVDHAIEAAAPSNSLSSATDPQRSLQRRKTPLMKGHLRHAYQEKLWEHGRWEDVVQEESSVSKCSTCPAITATQRYKCAFCEKICLCRGCYSQVHDIHPNHPFILVPDRPKKAQSEPDHFPNRNYDIGDEQSLRHPGVRCFHCMMEIVGARFHCIFCTNVDICSNCESAGLPGNLHSSDGGHDSSHILIKIPYPMDTRELQGINHQAMSQWVRDAPNIRLNTSGPQNPSDYARTVINSGSSRNALLDSPDNHGLLCNNCRLPIMGVRYQCAHCPSIPTSYNLCVNCEPFSYLIHTAMHIFFKLPRPVQRHVESPYPILPQLYKFPVGQGQTSQSDPRAYLKELKHDAALCDRCMENINGEWFHCVYCSRDLCETCEALDTHDDSHFFIVFKSIVDMQAFQNFFNLEAVEPTPIITYPVYFST